MEGLEVGWKRFRPHEVLLYCTVMFAVCWCSCVSKVFYSDILAAKHSINFANSSSEISTGDQAHYLLASNLLDESLLQNLKPIRNSTRLLYDM
nr:unnamed protein product [Haemonchus contortus]